MKLNFTPSAAKLTLFAAALLATSLFAGTANAQSAIKGKFTLQSETHWGKAVLPAGRYLLTSDSHLSNMLVVRDAKSGRTVAFEPITNKQNSGKGESALLIGTRGSQRVVHSFRVAEFGETFVYDPALAHQSAVEEARQAQAVPVVVAKK